VAVAVNNKADLSSLRAVFGLVTFDDSYPAGGEAVTAANFGLASLVAVLPFGAPTGIAVEFVRSTGKLKAYAASPAGFGGTAIVVKDDNDAASVGTAVKVVAREDGVLAFLESTNAGNADAVHALADGSVVQVNDNDTPGGVTLYLDEDATAPDSRFLHVSPTAKDVFVPTSAGELIRVKHDASAASNGVAVYFDDDGATAAQRLRFVSPTDANGAVTTDDTVSLNGGGYLDAGLAEVAAATDLSAFAVWVLAIGY
jgi:hypothetical protein